MMQKLSSIFALDSRFVGRFMATPRCKIDALDIGYGAHWLGSGGGEKLQEITSESIERGRHSLHTRAKSARQCFPNVFPSRVSAVVRRMRICRDELTALALDREKRGMAMRLMLR